MAVFDFLKRKSKPTTQPPLMLPEGEPPMPASGKVRSGSNRAFYERARAAESEAERVKREAIAEVEARTEAIKLQTERAKRAEAETSAWKQFGAERGKSESYEDYAKRTGKAAPGQQPHESTEEFRARVLREEQEASKRRGTYSYQSPEDLLSRLPPKERAKEEKKLRQAQADEAKARLEAARAGVSGSGEARYLREWINPFTVKKGEKYTDPNTGKVYGEGEMVPGHHVIITIPGSPLSPMELRLKTAIQVEQLKSLQPQSRKRKVATAIGQFGMAAAVNIAGTAMQGIAGTARGMQPGRGGPQRAVRMTVPTGANELFSIRRPSVDLSGLRMRPRTPSPAVKPSTMAVPRARTYNPAQGRTNLPTGITQTPNLGKIKKLRLW